MESLARQAGDALRARGIPVMALALVATLPHCIETYSLRDAGRIGDGGVQADAPDAPDALGGGDVQADALDGGDTCPTGRVRCDGGCVAGTACPSGEGLYWPMDEGTGTTVFDRTLNGNSGTFNAPTDPQWQPAVDCMSGSCLFFNGTPGNGDKVEVPLGPSLRSGTRDFTVSAWVRVDPGSAGDRPEVVVGTNRCGLAEGWLLNLWYGRPNFATYGPGSANGLMAPQRVDDGAWHQITGRRRGTTVQIVVDGVVANTAAVSAGYNSDAAGTVLVVGNQPVGTCTAAGGFEFRGYIDDVRMYGTTDPFAPLGCPSGQSVCGATCVDTQTDHASCGSCGHVCASGQTCAAGACAATVARYPVGAGPRAVGVDASGNVWVTNSNGNTVARMAPDGTVQFTVGGFNTPFGLGVESDGSVWIANLHANTATHVSASGAVLNTVPTGSLPTELAIDSAGNVWIPNYDSASITKVSPTGALLGTYFGVDHPQFITFDAAGNAWVGQERSTSVVELSASGTMLRSVNTGGMGPASIGFDLAGNLWVTINNGGSGSTVTELNPATGAILGNYSSGGSSPYMLAFDRHGNAWLCNINSNNVVELCGSAACGTIGAILATYAVGAYPVFLTIDSSGSVWTSNNTDNSVTRLLGVAR